MFDGLMINNLIAAVERAEHQVSAMSLEDIALIEMPVSLLVDSYVEEQVVN